MSLMDDLIIEERLFVILLSLYFGPQGYSFLGDPGDVPRVRGHVEDPQQTFAGEETAVCGRKVYTVVHLLKDTLAIGHISNKDRIVWQQVL